MRAPQQSSKNSRHPEDWKLDLVADMVQNRQYREIRKGCRQSFRFKLEHRRHLGISLEQIREVCARPHEDDGSTASKFYTLSGLSG